ncbi:MAG: cytochrome c biogenesis protein ResB [Thermodesulfobacteriota bacterium]
MLKKVFGFLGSKGFSIGLLVSGAAYLFYLTILGVMDVRTPQSFMVWGPLAVWGVLLVINLLINLLTRDYVYRGNQIFHIALVIVAVGCALSWFLRFSGDMVLTQGDTFFGGKADYARYRPDDSFERLAPNLSFRVEEITPEFWGNRVYFTGLEARIKYPAETLAESASVWLNGGPEMDGARLKIEGFGLFPELLVEEGKKGRPVQKGVVRVNLFPPGNEGILYVKSYRLYVRVLPDPGSEEGEPGSLRVNLKEPVFRLRVEWFGSTLYEGTLVRGETVRFGDLAVTFTGLRYWVGMTVIKDPGETVVFSGFVLALAGLAMRLYPRPRRPRKGGGGEGGEDL